jgi:peptidylprolyl isomerase
MLATISLRPSPSSARRFAAAVAAAAIVLSGCGSSEPTLEGTVVQDGLGCKVTQVERKDDVPTVAKVGETPKKLVKKDLTKGTGCKADAEGYLALDLVGATITDGKVFTSTWADERPITAKLGQGQLIEGLEQGLSGMKVGGRRQISVPAAQAYGAEGNAEQKIGKDQALVFVVDLIAVTDTPLYCNKAQPIKKGESADKPKTVDMPVDAPVKIGKEDLKVGTGKAAATGNYATINYLGVACSNGMEFDSSWDRGETFPFTMGEGTIPGFPKGIEGMKVGGLRQISIPADLAYGAQGNPPSIGANDPLVFIIELVALADKPPPSTTLPVDTTPTTVAEGATTTTAAGATTTAPAATTTTAAATTTTGKATTTTAP